MDRPLGLTVGTLLSNRAGAGLDPCGVLQTKVLLNASGTTEIVFFLGESASATEAQLLIKKYRDADLDAVFAEVTQQWDDTLGIVQVKTPDRALDILLNRWLPYQTLACRVWARTGFLSGERRLRFSRSVARRHGALRVAARHRARTFTQGGWRGNSSKATFSIGGYRRQATASVPACPMTAAGSLMSLPTMFRSRATLAYLKRWFRFWRAPH